MFSLETKSLQKATPPVEKSGRGDEKCKNINHVMHPIVV